MLFESRLASQVLPGLVLHGTQTLQLVELVVQMSWRPVCRWREATLEAAILLKDSSTFRQHVHVCVCVCAWVWQLFSKMVVAATH